MEHIAYGYFFEYTGEFSCREDQKNERLNYLRDGKGDRYSRTSAFKSDYKNNVSYCGGDDRDERRAHGRSCFPLCVKGSAEYFGSRQKRHCEAEKSQSAGAFACELFGEISSKIEKSYYFVRKGKCCREYGENYKNYHKYGFFNGR